MRSLRLALRVNPRVLLRAEQFQSVRKRVRLSVPEPRTEAATVPRKLAIFAVWSDRLRDAARVRHARPSPKHRSPALRRIQRQQDGSFRSSGMNRKSYRRERLIAESRHTSSMFLSPVVFALRTRPLR